MSGKNDWCIWNFEWGKIIWKSKQKIEKVWKRTEKRKLPFTELSHFGAEYNPLRGKVYHSRQWSATLSTVDCIKMRRNRTRCNAEEKSSKRTFEEKFMIQVLALSPNAEGSSFEMYEGCSYLLYSNFVIFKNGILFFF